MALLIMHYLMKTQIIGWIIDFAPYCIGFLIANSLAGAGIIWLFCVIVIIEGSVY